MEETTMRMYRVEAVAAQFDVSKATIYRAIESGALQALKIGTGRGALRIPADAIEDFRKACQQAAQASVQSLPVVA